MPPRRRRRSTPDVERDTVRPKRKSKYRLEKPMHPQPKWTRNDNGRLVSVLTRRANLGGRGDLEIFYHVEREDPAEVLPPPQTLWRQRYGKNHTVSYSPFWVDKAESLTEPLRRPSDVSSTVSSSDGDVGANVGLPYLYAYDEDVEPDQNGLQYRRWRPLKVLANGGYGVVVSYVDDARGFTGDADIADEDMVVAKFNYKSGDLVDIMSSVVTQIVGSEELRRAQLENEEKEQEEKKEGAAYPTPPATAKKARKAARAARRAARRAERAARRAARRGERFEPGRARIRRRFLNGYTDPSWNSHFQAPDSLRLDVDVTDTFRMENQILEMLDMTGSPHFPKFWKLAEPPQDGTVCTMDYIPGARTIDDQFNLVSNQKVPIRLLWEAVFCLSKAMSVMAYGSEDPAPSHRVHGWNQIVHLDWSLDNIFVRRDSPSHTCSHGPCFMAGDFGFALVVPNRPRARAAFRLEHLKNGWHKGLNDTLPEANFTTTQSFEARVDEPIIGHFSHKTNVFLLAEVWNEGLGYDGPGRTGIMRYKQDNLTPVEQARLRRNPRSLVPLDERFGRPLQGGDDDDDDDDEDEDDYAPRVRGYVDVAESILAQPIAQNLGVSEQRFVNLMTRCRNTDPAKRPEIEEIMLFAATGMAEAGVYVPPPPSSSSSSSGSDSEDGQDGEDEEQ